MWDGWVRLGTVEDGWGFYIKILVKIAFFLLKMIKNGWIRLGTVEDGGGGRGRKWMERGKDRNFYCI